MAVPPELDWLLARAFGPMRPDGDISDGLDVERLVAQGRDLALLGRIRSRSTQNYLAAQIGDPATEVLNQTRREITVAAMRNGEVCRRIAGLSRDRPIPVIFLKGLALQLTGVTPPGSRVTGDIDILVPKHQAQTLHERLVEEGGRQSGLRDSDQHLSLVTDGLGASIEVHYHLKGLDLEGAGIEGPVANDGLVATATECFDLGLVDPAPELPDHCYVTSEKLTVAYLLVHALAHHALAPAIYPGLQFLADLQDLGYSLAGGKEISQTILKWISSEVSADLVTASLSLLGRLENGERASEIAAGTDGAAVVLHHLLAGAFDEEYRLSLKLGNQLTRVDGGLRQDWPRRIWRALWLTPTQIDLLYGKPKTKLGYIGWQLWRPFHLVEKSISSGRAWLKLRRRRR
jgi:hypothetical protein